MLPFQTQRPTYFNLVCSDSQKHGSVGLHINLEKKRVNLMSPLKNLTSQNGKASAIFKAINFSVVSKTNTESNHNRLLSIPTYDVSSLKANVTPAGEHENRHLEGWRSLRFFAFPESIYTVRQKTIPTFNDNFK
ncbi:hypothetical protein O181_030001 [Austropuccinia psidii MF-1]|uniref:Uncharacterized protein n=1 Tax=Austropuccinia psidii MF-1 TaxID=1389203 RepID=A0A9Q3H3U6_9BASI|nr:hypothetical protein [Austropuccinia psidii MF-1]